MEKVNIYTCENAMDFFGFSQIYNPIKIRNIVEKLYSEQLLAVGLKIDDKPAGFVSAFKLDQNQWQCNILFVSEDYPQNEYAKKLLSTLIEEAKKNNVKLLTYRYMENEHCSKRLLALLKSFGFKTSTKTRRCFIIPVSELEKFKVKVDKKYSRYLELKNGKVMKCLNELTHGEIEQLKAQRGVQYPELFYPFLTDDIDLDLSRIIYINDDPAAWIIFKLLSTSVVYVDRLHIKKLYKFRGLFFPLFYNTYINLSEEIKKIVLYIRGNNSKMLGLFKLFNDCEKAEDTAVELIKDLTVD